MKNIFYQFSACICFFLVASCTPNPKIEVDMLFFNGTVYTSNANFEVAEAFAIKDGKIIEQPIYSFVTHNRTKDTVQTHPRKVIIFEGILIFNNEELRNLFDIKIFVHADTDERLIRRIRRDISERGRDIDEVLSRYQTTLKPMHQQFIEPTKNFADLIIPNDKFNTVAVDIVRTVINEKLQNEFSRKD